MIEQLFHFSFMKTESFRVVPLESLLKSDIDRFTLHKDLTVNLSADFLSSITRYGLFHPPVVMKVGEAYQVICGRRRIQALQTIGNDESVFCRVADVSDSVELLATILEDQRLSGPLSAIMSARFLKLTDSLIPKESRDAVMTQLHLGSYGHLQRLLPLLTLEQSIRDSIHNDDISDKVGLILCSLSPEDRLFLCELFLALSLNKNKQKRLLDMCQILIAQRGGTFRDLFHENFRDFLPENITSNRPQTAGNLLRFLYEASHPLSNNAEKIFNERKHELGLPDGCNLSHSPAFEKDRVTLSFDFENFEEMARIWQKIKIHLE